MRPTIELDWDQADVVTLAVLRDIYSMNKDDPELSKAITVVFEHIGGPNEKLD